MDPSQNAVEEIHRLEDTKPSNQALQGSNSEATTVKGRRKPNGRERGKFDANNPVSVQFKEYAMILDSRHDQHERLVKLSRDITIESKRTIFLLHRINGVEDDKILSEAEAKLGDIKKNHWRRVANELSKIDQPLQFFKAFTAGLQEFIEAMSFFHFIKFGTILLWSEVAEFLTFPLGSSDSKDTGTMKNSSNLESVSHECERKLEVPVPKLEFLLGIADLTGELMRKAVSSAATGNTQIPFSIFGTMQDMYSYFEVLDGILGNAGFNRKVKVLEQSLKKVERVCYHIQIRVGEIPQDLIGHYIKFSAVNDREDETQFDNL